MRVLVTGATGFIGANLVRLLLDQGCEVRALRRSSSSNRVLDGLKAEIVTGMLEDPKSMTAAVRGCEQIYHLAGAYETGPGAYERVYRCHVTGTRVLCEAALREGVRRMVVCSSSITLPFGPIDAPAREDDPDPFERSGVPYRAELRAYYEAKRSQERVVRRFVERGLEAVLVHPDFVIGPWDAKPSSGAIIIEMARRPWLPFYPPGGKSFISVRDCVRGHMAAMTRGRPGASYLLGDHNLTFKDAMTVIARVVGRPPPRAPLPRAFLSAGRLLERHLGERYPVAAQLSAYLDSLYLSRHRSAEKAHRELGLGSTPFEDAVESAFRWFKDQGMV